MRSEPGFPLLPYAELPTALAPVHTYAKFLGQVRRALTPSQKHWYHASLRIAVNGLTTTPIPAPGFTFDMLLDLVRHELVITTSRGDQMRRALQGQPAQEFCDVGLGLLEGMGITPEIDRTLFADTMEYVYAAQPIQTYFQALVQTDTVLKEFKSGLREETGPVQFWPHHFDLAVLWFSGRLVPGTDPADPEYADEQMNFGFSPGDQSIPNPYFYATAYPTPDGLTDVELPAGAYWHTEGWTGAVMTYESVLSSDDPTGALLGFLRTVQNAGATLMV